MLCMFLAFTACTFLSVKRGIDEQETGAMLGPVVLENSAGFGPIGNYTAANALYGVDIVDNIAYVAAYDAGLHCFDISNPSDPQLIGSCDTPGTAQDVAVEGNVAFVADSNYLRCINVTNPRKPALLGSVMCQGTNIAVTGQVAYMVGITMFATMTCVDVSNPSKPTIITTYNAPMGTSLGPICPFGNFLYCAAATDGLKCLNITDLHAISVVATYNTPYLAQGVVVSGDVAYLANENSGLMCFNVSNPRSIVPLGTCPTSGIALRVCLSGMIAIVTNYSPGGIDCINVTNPSSPFLIKTYTSSSDYPVRLDVEGGFVCVTDDFSKTLEVFRIADRVTPAYVGSLDLPGISTSITVNGRFAFLTTHSEGLRIIDVTNPTAPVQRGIYKTTGNASNVEVRGLTAFVAYGTAGLVCVNISNINNPVKIGSYSTPTTAYDVDVKGGITYVADYNSRMYCLNTSNPSNPTNIGYYPPAASSCTGVSVKGSLAYTTTGNGYLRILNVTNPASPTQITSINGFGTLRGMFIGKNIAYIGGASSGLFCVNISIPSNPVNLGSLPGTYAFRVVVQDGIGYTADQLSSIGMRVVNFTNPAAPQLISTHYLSQGVTDACISGAYLYMANDVNGLQIYKIMGYDWERPTMPQAFTATGGKNNVTVQWSAPASSGSYPITNYSIYRGESVSTMTLLTTIGIQTAYEDTSAVPGVVYHYSITARNVAGESNKSAPASAMPFTLPGVPIGLGLQSGNMYNQLTWSPPAADGFSAITNYSIYRGTNASVQPFLVTVGNVTTFIDTNLQNGQPYYYRIAAVNEAGVGTQTSYSIGVPKTTPLPPSNVTASISSDDISLSWQVPASNGGSVITGYSIYRGTAENGETFLTLVGNVTTFTDIAVADRVIYYYKITARNSAGESDRSEEVFAIVENTIIQLSNPSNITYVVGATGSNIIWTITDPDVVDGWYSVSKDGVEMYSGYWVSGQNVLVNVDGLPAGTYNYSINVTDGLGSEVQDVVSVVVRADENFWRVLFEKGILIPLIGGIVGGIVSITFLVIKRKMSKIHKDRKNE